MVFEKETNKLLFDCIAVDNRNTKDIIDAITYSPQNIPDNFSDLYEENSDEYEETFNTVAINDNDYTIDINSFDDQGDIVYQWGIRKTNENGYIVYDEQYWNTKEEAVNTAKIVLKQITNNEKIVIPKRKTKPINTRMYMGKSGSKFFI